MSTLFAVIIYRIQSPINTFTRIHFQSIQIFQIYLVLLVLKFNRIYVVCWDLVLTLICPQSHYAMLDLGHFALDGLFCV